MKKTFSKEEKKVYFNNLREQWKVSKELSETDETAKALYREAGFSFSYSGFYFAYAQMKAQGLSGIPYVDCKTFQGWQSSGFRVRKGEKSTVKGVTWLTIENKQVENDDGYMIPKEYHLFHYSQVETITA